MSYQDQLKKALAVVSKAYVPGCADYYSSFEPDQWQQAHDCLDEAIISREPIRVKHQLTIFENTCLALIKSYTKSKERILA